MPSAMMSVSVSAARMLTAAEVVSAAQRPAGSAHTRAAAYRRTHTAAAAAHRDDVAAAPADCARRPPSADERRTIASMVSSTRTQPFSPTAAAATPPANEETSTSGLSAQKRCVRRVREAARRSTGAAEPAAQASAAATRPLKPRPHRRQATKKSAESGVATPPDNPLRSLESSQVLPSLELVTPPAPTNRVRSRRRSESQWEAAVPETQPSAGAVDAAALVPVPVAPRSTPKPLAVPPPPPSPPPPSPPPAILPVLSSFSNSALFFPEAAAAHQFSGPTLNYHPSVSAELVGSDPPSFEYENGYGMFYIDAADPGMSSHDEAAAAHSRCSMPPPPTSLKTAPPLNRRHRRESFVSFGGEIRLA